MTQWLVRRGLLATVPVASLVLAFGACSSEPSDPATGVPVDQPSSAPLASGEREIVSTAIARDRLKRVTGSFTRTVKVGSPPSATLPNGKPANDKARPELHDEARPVLSAGHAERFLERGDSIRAEVSKSLKAGTLRSATVDLPRTADGFVRIQPDGSTIAIEFAAKGAKPGVPLETADGLVNYPAAAPGGGDMVLRVTNEAVEDFIVLNTKPERPVVDYAVNVSDVAGLRHLDNSLEFLSSNGDPQIRVRPPEVIDARGVTHKARLELPDCKADTNPLPPWDRPVTAPGASQCTVRISWDDKKVTYPAIVDPIWVAAGSMLTARWRNAMVKQNLNGFVLSCGGLDNNGDTLLSCEVFNPGGGAGLGSWAVGPVMKKPRSQFTMLAIGNDVLAVGDNSYSPATVPGYGSELLSGGVWTVTATDFSTGNFSPPTLQPILTENNAFVVLVDQSGTPFRYSVAAKAWTAGTSNANYRYNYMTLPNGPASIMRCGGAYGSSAFKTCEKYTPATDVWVMPAAPGAVSDMNAARGDPAWARIDANRLILFGGYNYQNNTPISNGEVYSASTNTWVTTTSITNTFTESPLHNTWATHSGSSRILSIAGYSLSVYDPVANTWTQLNNYDSGNNYFYAMPYGYTAVASAGSKVLVGPVSPTGNYGAFTNCKLFDVGEKGATCNTSGECGTNLTCVKENQYDQGYCCDTTCTDPCYSCRADRKQSGADGGTCGPRRSDWYVGTTVCPGDTQDSCKNVGGYCNGVDSGCLQYSNTTYCGGNNCADGDTQNNTRYCDGAGSCATQTTTDCTTGYACIGSQCQSQCYSDDYCTSSYYCQTWVGTDPYYNCYPKKSNGQACSNNSNTECASNHCVNGVCCDTECSGTCEACTLAATGQTTGTCKPITAGTDPRSECSDFGASFCGQNGSCNGAGACQTYASGTQCADIASCASETTRNIPDTCNGTGTCNDKGTQACATGYSCQAGSCNTQCTSDANCTSNFWCDIANKLCVPDRTQGQACLRDAVCSGNANCVDSVCCNSACSGDCQSCLQANTGVADGSCSNVLDDLDPKNKCTTGAAYPNSCAAPGLCNGAGACRPYAKLGIECDTDVCVDSTLTTYECSGAGTCKPKSVQCYPFKCDTTNNVCRVACSLDAHCVDGSSCENGTCVGQLELGQPCTRDAQCKGTSGPGSGHCANIGEGLLQGDETGAGGDGAGGAAGDPGTDSPGVCCDDGCQGTCLGCKASLKGFGSDGICEFVKNNTDPANDCVPAADDKCGLDGQCNGGGACRLAPSGTSCGESSCQGNSVLGQSCNGQGDCINNQGGVDCAPYVCRDVLGAFQCTQPCAEDNDCQDGYFCEEALCKKKLANGKTCGTSGICDSGYCVDGVCCDASCNGQCEACDAPGSEGVCSPVQGEPHGARAKCDFAGEECGGACDGVNAAACKYAATGTTCGQASCNNGLANSSVCNGQGECRANAEAECSPYVCGEDETCLSRCEIDADCSQGYACDETTQRCLPAVVSAECSEDRLSSVGQNGISTPCKPFLCVPASGTCAVSCAATTDCSPEFVCEASTKTCLPAPPDSGTGDEEGCACRAAGASTPSSSYGLALVALGLALTGLRRRKRFTQSPARASKPARFESGSHLSE